MARAKQTGRAEARRRYRQAMQQDVGEEAEDTSLDFGERPAVASRAQDPSHAATRGRQPEAPVRPGITGAFRAAYHRANVREDLAALPQVLRSRGFLAAIALVLVGAAAVLVAPESSFATFAWELLVLPGSALAPQLVAGFFAPRASYLLGFIVGLLQGLVFLAFLTVFATRLGANIPPDQFGSFVVLAFFSGPISGLLFAAAAAWYRRFLALSSPRRNARSGQKPGQRRSATAQAKRR